MSVDSRRVRVSAALVLGAAVVVWNAVFDRGIADATNRYLALQQQHTRGDGPFVYVQDVMRPAAAESARRASTWSALVGLAGLGAVGWVSRRPRRPRS